MFMFKKSKYELYQSVIFSPFVVYPALITFFACLFLVTWTLEITFFVLSCIFLSAWITIRKLVRKG